MWLLTAYLLARTAQAALHFESIQLATQDVDRFRSIAFADRQQPHQTPQAKCKAWPGTPDWPSASEWQMFNASLDGALLQPKLPATAACYPSSWPEFYDAAKCSYLLTTAMGNEFYTNDPLTVLTQWPQGATCLPAANATGNCTLGGYPVYVVNATTVKQVQATVNFARNKNIRLVIKNTGHDFGGRSVGAGSISLWTHHLQEFQTLREFTKSNYSGTAAQFGSGLEQWELFNNMYRYNITMVGGGLRSIGANGGWFAGGGHGSLASFYGLAADQALELHVVTADGRFVVADEENNTDLFFALRGGGGSTFGVVTSVIIKTYPPTTLSTTYIGIACNPPADTNARARLAPISESTNFVNDTERFWTALDTYFRFKPAIVDAGGVDWDYLYPLGNNSYSFRTRISFVNLTTADQVADHIKPLMDSFSAAGFNFLPLNQTELVPIPYAPTSLQGPASSLGLSNTRYRSRLMPRRNWENAELWNKTFAAIRSVAQDGGYTLHSLAIGASEAVAGWPGRSAAVNPAWRHGVLHLSMMTAEPAGLSAAQAVEEEKNVQKWAKRLRDATPGGGSYMNEGDPGEPDWQQSFFGSNYERLLQIKRARDPWGVFWAQTTVGSEAWEVVTLDGYPRSQNGRLCKTGES
ncbi:putative fad binding domain-protein [Echria macrotheca]|uniref:Fad binding domain-protein n=1 Tax=Echria macrotheca TaxID=438768 RepID=A0AAJ0F7C1_9PEZI|nr:putative fad binding domain-protein [Echria macrotheca]